MAICFGTGPEGDFYEFSDLPCLFPQQGTALRRLRRIRGWSLRDLSIVLGVNIVKVSNFERGIEKMKVEERKLLNRGSHA